MIDFSIGLFVCLSAFMFVCQSFPYFSSFWSAIRYADKRIVNISSKTYISRITYQATTLFAQRMRYLNLHIVCKN